MGARVARRARCGGGAVRWGVRCGGGVVGVGGGGGGHLGEAEEARVRLAIEEAQLSLDTLRDALIHLQRIS